jgi:hypothetical protein
MTHRFKWMVLAVALTSLLRGSVAYSQARGDGQGAQGRGDGFVETKGLFVWVVARDLRKCVAPMCGGYWVRALNIGQDEYVSDIDLGAIGAVSVRQMEDAADGELVIYGHFGPTEPNFHTRNFIARKVFRGMPGIKVDEQDGFYVVQDREPPIECFVAPCSNEIGTLLNTQQTYNFDGLSVAGASEPWMDEDWLTERVRQRHAIVSASLVNGQLYPGGYEQILDASQVFVRLPYFDGPCQFKPTRFCASPFVNAYTRTADHCLVSDGCAEPGICPMYVPGCSPGYTLQSWLTQPNGCPAYSCDPSFTVK